MSKGYGWLQRAILEYLAREDLTCYGGDQFDLTLVPMYEIAKAVFNVSEPTGSQLVSLRRAVRGLVADGRVITERFMPDSWYSWSWRRGRDKPGPDDAYWARTYTQRRQVAGGSRRQTRVTEIVISELWVSLPPPRERIQARYEGLRSAWGDKTAEKYLESRKQWV